MAGAPRLEDRLERLGRVRDEDAPTDDRKQGIKARLFGDPAPPNRIGRFIDLGLLGHGAMGTVRRAYDERLAREVAIKVVRQRRARRHHGRLLREAQALAQLSHPNVVQVYETGEVGGEIFIAMELVDGVPLDQWQRTPHSWRECLDVYVQAGRGLAAAHEAGLVHRDFKPSNCIRDERGRVRVLDFGLARALESEAELPEGPSPVSAASTAISSSGSRSSGSTKGSDTMLQAQLTASNAVVGTIAYMAPEQFAGDGADARSDQFSFCVALYEAIHGEPPFGRDPRPQLLKLLGGVREPPAFSSSVKVPAIVRRVLRRGMEGKPAGRWPSMEALLEELEKALRPGRWRSAGMMVLLAAGAATGTALAITGNDADPSACKVETLGSTDETREAILGTGLPYAEQTWLTVDRELRSYANRLDGALESTCEARRLPTASSTLDAQQTCLATRRVQFDRTLEMLGVADEPTVENAVSLVNNLPSVEDCLNVRSFRPRDVEAASKDPERVQEITKLLGEARVLLLAGRNDDGLAPAIDAVAKAELLGAPLLQAEARLVQGRALMDFQPEEARAPLEEAARLAIRNGDHELIVGAYSNLIHVLGVDEIDPPLAKVRGDDALDFAGNADVTWQTRAVAYVEHGHLSNARGELEEAEGHYRQALQVLEERHGQGSEHLSLADPLDGLATVFRKQDKIEEALAHRRRALDIRVRALGEQHPATALTTANLATIYFHQEQYDLAREHLENAIAVFERSYEPDHPEVLRLHRNLADILGSMARLHRDQTPPDLDAAIARFEEGIAELERAGLESDSRMASLSNGLGRVMMMMDDAAEAERLHLGALEIYRASPDDHDMIAQTHRYLAHALAEQDAWKDALKHVDLALEGLTALEDPDVDEDIQDAQQLRERIVGNL